MRPRSQTTCFDLVPRTRSAAELNTRPGFLTRSDPGSGERWAGRGGERQSAFYELLLDVAPASHHYDDEPILQLRKPER